MHVALAQQSLFGEQVQLPDGPIRPAPRLPPRRAATTAAPLRPAGRPVPRATARAPADARPASAAGARATCAGGGRSSRFRQRARPRAPPTPAGHAATGPWRWPAGARLPDARCPAATGRRLPPEAPPKPCVRAWQPPRRTRPATNRSAARRPAMPRRTERSGRYGDGRSRPHNVRPGAARHPQRPARRARSVSAAPRRSLRRPSGRCVRRETGRTAAACGSPGYRDSPRAG